MPNPYTERMGLANPDLFVGRSADIRDAVNNLTAAKPSSVAILGPSRIGKTSLMQHVHRLIMLRDRPDVHCVLVSPQSIRNREEMFGRLSKCIAKALLPDDKARRPANSPIEFEDLINEALGKSSLLLFMDDMDDWSFPSPEVRFEMYNTLRSTVWQHRMALCLTTRHPMVDLCKEGDAMGSLLWNIFNTVQPGLLSKTEARELLFTPHKKQGMEVTEEEGELVFGEAGTQPCLIQIAAYRLFEAKQAAGGSPVGAEQFYYLRQHIHRDMLGYFPVFLNYLRERAPFAVASAAALARHKPIPDAHAQLLIDLGAAHTTQQGLKLLSDAFSAFLLSEVAEVSLPGQLTEAKPVNTAVPPPVQSVPEKAGEAFVFISACSKDYPLAQQVYDFMTSRGVQAFFSAVSLPQIGRSDYRRAIDNALERAAHLVLVASKLEHVRTPWVEAEWGSFINDLRSGRKSGNLITLIAGSLTINSLPPSLRNFEVIPLNPEGLEKALLYVADQPAYKPSH